MDFLQRLGIDEVNSGAMSLTWQASIGSRDSIDSINPANESFIATVAASTGDDLSQLMERAQQAFLLWRDIPAPKRGEIIRQIGDELRRQKSDLGSLVSLEMGKSKQEGDGEVQEMIDIADFAVGQSRMLYGKTMHSERYHHRMYEQWHPYGVVGIISAFNFPVAVWAWNAFIAAICGNVCIWKPSEKTPLCAVAVQKICNRVLQANDCPDIFSYFVPKDLSIADRFIADKRIPLISFTGSTATGQHVAEVVHKRLGKTILELGGNNAILVDKDADMSLVIPSIVFGAVGTAGQRCTTTRRVFVHSDRYQQVLDRLQHAYRQITIGDPLDENNLMGPLIDERAVQQYQAAISKCQEQGAEIVFGGKVLEKKGFYVEPTIVTQVKNEWDIVQTETFAPILYVMQYDDLDQAIHDHNNVAQGLSSAMFTQNIRHAEQFLSCLGSDCGIANINIGTSGAEIGGAFGGEKETGGGRESGSDAWKGYMRRQTNTINWSHELPLAQGIKFEVE